MIRFRFWFDYMSQPKTYAAMDSFTNTELSTYRKDGFIVARSLFSEKEINLLGQTVRSDSAMDQSSTERDDGQGISGLSGNFGTR